MKPFYVYILHCADDSYYVGQTDDIELRLSQHKKGEDSSYTSARLPVEIVYLQDFASRDQAVNAERQIKGWSRKKKMALINDDWGTLKQSAKKKFAK